MPSDFQRKPRRKFCGFCKDKVDYVDYKDIGLLKRYMSEKGKIRPRRITGNCTQHQRDLATAIKRAREVALIAYSRK
ncbi:MAG TPA: 30S ribosomal protein S18 [Actinobacteria bacterium]|nr:30S ribosomal protein S18 [Actinomycetota bacterium]